MSQFSVTSKGIHLPSGEIAPVGDIIRTAIEEVDGKAHVMTYQCLMDSYPNDYKLEWDFSGDQFSRLFDAVTATFLGDDAGAEAGFRAALNAEVPDPKIIEHRSPLKQHVSSLEYALLGSGFIDNSWTFLNPSPGTITRLKRCNLRPCILVTRQKNNDHLELIEEIKKRGSSEGWNIDVVLRAPSEVTPQEFPLVYTGMSAMPRYVRHTGFKTIGWEYNPYCLFNIGNNLRQIKETPDHYEVVYDRGRKLQDINYEKKPKYYRYNYDAFRNKFTGIKTILPDCLDSYQFVSNFRVDMEVTSSKAFLVPVDSLYASGECSWVEYVVPSTPEVIRLFQTDDFVYDIDRCYSPGTRFQRIPLVIDNLRAALRVVNAEIDNVASFFRNIHTDVYLHARDSNDELPHNAAIFCLMMHQLNESIDKFKKPLPPDFYEWHAQRAKDDNMVVFPGVSRIVPITPLDQCRRFTSHPEASITIKGNEVFLNGKMICQRSGLYKGKKEYFVFDLKGSYYARIIDTPFSGCPTSVDGKRSLVMDTNLPHFYPIGLVKYAASLARTGIRAYTWEMDAYASTRMYIDAPESGDYMVGYDGTACYG